MGLSRRTLLQGGVAIAVLGLAPVRWVASASAAPAKTESSGSWFRRTTYAPLVGSVFVVSAGTSRAPLTLSTIGDLTPQTGKQRAGTADERFSLLFTSGSAVREGTWPVHHDVLGDASLFLVPVGPKATLQTYEVIVNRLT